MRLILPKLRSLCGPKNLDIATAIKNHAWDHMIGLIYPCRIIYHKMWLFIISTYALVFNVTIVCKWHSSLYLLRMLRCLIWQLLAIAIMVTSQPLRLWKITGTNKGDTAAIAVAMWSPQTLTLQPQLRTAIQNQACEILWLAWFTYIIYHVFHTS